MFNRFLFSLVTSCFRLYEWLRVALRYYPRFLPIDLLLAFQYLFKSPHRISKAFLSQRGESNVYQFGETPLTTLDQIARICHILSHDVVYELGCGTGRTCFWLRTFVKCRVVGIDYLPSFIEKASYVKKKRRLNQIDFLQTDMLTADFAEATVIYLYGTCLEDATIEKLITRLKNPAQEGLGILHHQGMGMDRKLAPSAPKGAGLPQCRCKPSTRIITVSYPLTDYSQLFKVTQSFPARFPWGTTTVYLNEWI